MNPRRDTLLRRLTARGGSNGVLAVLSNQVLLGGQLVAIYRDSDEAELRNSDLVLKPKRVAYVDFHHANPERYERIGSLPDAAARVLGQFSPGVPAIKTKVLLEPIDQLGRQSGGFIFDAKWTTADIMARVNDGALSLAPVLDDLIADAYPSDDIGEELRNRKVLQDKAVASGRYYFAITPYDEPFTMLEVVPATKTAQLSAIHEVPHESINVDLIWEQAN
jgi:hypothetical protein